MAYLSMKDGSSALPLIISSTPTAKPHWLTANWDASPLSMAGMGLCSSKPNKKGDNENMETLYEVIVVTQDREIILDKKVIAGSEKEAEYEADVHGILKATKLKHRDVTIICNHKGYIKVRDENGKKK
jgi:hypothetical protein